MVEQSGISDLNSIPAGVRASNGDSTRGELRVFLGYAAGVGKTYAMLEAAQRRLSAGADIAVGYVETHQQQETDALLDGLEIISRREKIYRGMTLTEMDVDAVLSRQPQIVLVDDLAHTNIPDSRHPKRYLDIEDLLRKGVDVYTTVNVQHVESLNDIIVQITGITVDETVPDRFFDAVDQIELIDILPEDLLKRLEDGKWVICGSG